MQILEKASNNNNSNNTNNPFYLLPQGHQTVQLRGAFETIKQPYITVGNSRMYQYGNTVFTLHFY